MGGIAFIREGFGTPRCCHVDPKCDTIFGGNQFGSRLGVAVALATRFGSDLEKVWEGFERILASSGTQLGHNDAQLSVFGFQIESSWNPKMRQ